MSLIIVTPIHNEEQNIGKLAEQLSISTRKPDVWIVVDDGSTDRGADIVRGLDLPMETIVLTRSNQGGLIGGSAFTAWQYGVDYQLARRSEFDYVMKLDADVELPSQYLEKALADFENGSNAGLVGGVLVGKGHREQTIHVPGPVKLYSAAAYKALADVPRVVGFDVMDELAIKAAGMQIRVRRDLPFTVRRAIGASQGLVHGRRRNGLVCRWTGYWSPYFALHALRYAARKPYFVGAIAMVHGYLTAPPGPYPHELTSAHAAEQRRKLREAVKAPRRWIRETYGITP
ncbi:glycosyltransferase family 2 protein [Rhodococcus sp. USK13]|uniref:glycosyltransferase family A protein n=1 Tax=Rhodococcus sp. USK13 TaxID=2806442 RepID=UPI001BCF62D8|nr:glycosyltransferase family 2 protein [Rhodococcus sp. USK13]